VLAREAGNYLELATTLVGKSGFYLPGDMDTAIQVTHGASLLLSSQAPSGLTAWIWGERAMQEAELGHEIEAMRYLERALQVAATDPAGLNLFSPDLAASWLDRRPAVVALKLKRSDEALSILEENSRKLDPRLTREVVLNLTDQATAWAMRKEPQRACVTLVQAVQLAVSSGNRRGVDLARQVREQQLAKWRSDQHVRDLDEVIRVARRSI